MVRYPHTAIVTISNVQITDGEYAGDNPSTSEIKGRFEPSEGISRVKDPDGEYTQLKGKFFTKSEPIPGAGSLAVNGETFTILRWHPYQTQSEIWLV